MSESTLRILTYNIHKGYHPLKRSYIIDHLREAIQSSQTDVVFLQEVLGQHVKIGETNQYEFLADTIWEHFSYGRNAIYNEGHHGNAILSKFPIVAEDNLDISTNSMERRGVLYGKIELPQFSKPVHLFCTHLNLFESSRKYQLKKLSEFIVNRTLADEPLIVAGDFNDWGEKASMELSSELGLVETSLIKNGKHAKTFPSIFPVLSLDRIYVRGFDVLKTEVLFQKHTHQLSDHLAIRSELKLREKK